MQSFFFQRFNVLRPTSNDLFGAQNHVQFHLTQDAIASSTAAPGSSCYRLEFYQADPLVSEAACRGAHVNDNQAAYFKAGVVEVTVVKCPWVLTLLIL